MLDVFLTILLAQSPRRTITDCKPVNRGGVVRCQRTITECQYINRGGVIRCQRPPMRSRSFRRRPSRTQPSKSNE